MNSPGDEGAAQVDHALLLEAERFRTLVELSPEAMYVVRDQVIVYVNPAAVRLFGATDASQLVGTHILDRVDPAFHDLALERRRRVAEHGISAPLTEMHFLTLDGTPVPVEVHATAISYDGQPAIHAAVRDVTVRKAAEAALQDSQERLRQSQKLEAVGRLAGGVAHDFNNALAVILGHTEFALRQVDPATPLYDDIREIERAAQHSADLTRQLLAYARRQTISPRRLDLNAAVADSVNDHHQRWWLGDSPCGLGLLRIFEQIVALLLPFDLAVAFFLVSDVASDHVLVDAHRAHEVSTRPEVVSPVWLLPQLRVAPE